MKVMKTISFLLRWQAAGLALMIIAWMVSSGPVSAQVSVTGTVTDASDGHPLPGAHVSTGGTTLPAVSDTDGRFRLERVRKGDLTLRVSYVGFQTAEITLKVARDTVLTVNLHGTTLLGNEVSIIGTRAQERYPAAFASLNRKEIRSLNLGKDIPFLIQGTPSTVVTSDAGNGIGYSGISIRGTDLTRINVTINSIPLNEPESQGVWFVDLPDLASSTENIQVQRGVGTSTNGAGAFGASINFLTSDLQQDPYGELNLSGGSYNTFKSTLKFGTGLMKSRFSIDGRLSLIRSDGYIDRAGSNLRSYYLSGGYYGKRTTVRIITFSGTERTYQAWEGVPKDSLATHRTFNPAGMYLDEQGKIAYYDGQTDNYRQDHYQFHFSQLLAKGWNLNTAVHYTKGFGYYENYKQNEGFSEYGLPAPIIGNDTVESTDLINRKLMDNDFFGITYSSRYSRNDRWSLIVGGAWNRYHGRHSGKIIWARHASAGSIDRNWYYNTGLKKDLNLYLKGEWQVLAKIRLFADLQYRRVTYSMNGTLDDLRILDQSHEFNFFNPKAGIFFTPAKHHSLFFSFGVANREPSRNNYKDADSWRIPTHERLYDYELGYNLDLRNIKAGTCLYYMNYRDQLVLTGEINNVGEAVMVNVPHSYRAGIEWFATALLLNNQLQIDLNVTLSRNRIRHYTHYIDTYDAGWNYLGQDTIRTGETSIAFSPSLNAGATVTWRPLTGFSVAVNGKYISRQYIDNTSDRGRSLDGYLSSGLTAGYSIPTRWLGEIGLSLSVNNLLNRKYATNAWVYPYYVGGKYAEANGYFPQALIHFLAGITVKI